MKQLLISGKLGELYQIWIPQVQSAKNNKKLNFRPFEEINASEEEEKKEEDEEELYDIVEDNPHQKNIYYIAVGKFQGVGLVITIGIDRKICIWNQNPVGIIKLDTFIPCIGGRVNLLRASPSKPGNILCACGDGTLKIWNLNNKENKFFTISAWREIPSHFHMKSIAFDPKAEPTVAFSGETTNPRGSKGSSSTLIGVYDLFDQVMDQVISAEFLLDIEFFKWMPVQILSLLDSPGFSEHLYRLFGRSAGKNQKRGPKTREPRPIINWRVTNQKNSSHKRISAGFVVLFYARGFGFYCLTPQTSQIEPISDGSELLGEVVDMTFLPQKERVVLVETNRFGSITFFSWDALNKFSSQTFSNVHNQFVSTLEFAPLFEKSPVFLCAAGSFDRKISLYSLPVDSSNAKGGYCEQIRIYEKLSHKFRIIQIRWSSLEFGIFLNFCENHSSVQIWNGDPSPKITNAKDRQIGNIRGHRCYILDAIFSNHEKETVVTCNILLVWLLILGIYTGEIGI